jgi:hypothetical protein
MRFIQFVIFLLASLISFAIATPSQSFEQKTGWYTIRVMPPNDASPLLFLTQTSNGLRLERYRSGDVTQMWAIVQPDYPTGAAVTGSGPLSGIFDKCFNSFPPSCDFQGHAGVEVRLVSRSSGWCVAVGSSRSTAVECSQQPNEAGWERLSAYLLGGATGFKTKNGNCLVANTDDAYGDGLRVRAVSCSQSSGWSGEFVTNKAADLTCKTQWDWNLCFVEGQGR